MYDDTQSIRVFERQHARDQLAELARHGSRKADLDLLAAHSGDSEVEGWLMTGLSVGLVIALFCLAGLALA
jgi:hypothetical protein